MKIAAPKVSWPIEVGGRSFAAPLSNQSIRIVLFALIAAGLALRLYDFTGPILTHHYIRQVDTAALARNFAEEGMNILFPRIDWRGASSGIVESELQIYTYPIAVLYRLFGERIELARALNLTYFTACAVVLFAFTRRMFDAPTALLAVLFYAVTPMHAYFAHSIQPDTLMVMCSLAAVYFFWRWCDEERLWLLAVSALALCAAVMIKPLNLYLAAPLFYLSFRKLGWGLFRNIHLWAYGAAVLAPAIAWYMHAYSLWIEHGNTLFRAYSEIGLSWLWEPVYPAPVLSLTYGSYVSDLVWRAIYLVATPAGFLALVLGVVAAVEKKAWLIFVWIGAFAPTMLLFAEQHRLHDYYQMPIALMACILMALGVVRLWSRTEKIPRLIVAAAWVVLTATGALWFWLWKVQGGVYHSNAVWATFFVLASVLTAAFLIPRAPRRALVAISLALVPAYAAWQVAQLMRVSPANQQRIAFAERVAALTDPNGRIVLAHNSSRATGTDWFQHKTAEGEYLAFQPVDFYLSRRKGWSVTGEQLTPEFLEALRQRGAAYFATTCCVFGPDDNVMASYPDLREFAACAYEPLEVSEQWSIYRLTPPRPRPDGSPCITTEYAPPSAAESAGAG